MCDKNHRVLQDGSCEKCPPYQKAQDELNTEGVKGTICGPDQCGPSEILQEDGTCLKCDEF